MGLSSENGQAVRDDSGAYTAMKQRLMAVQQARYASLSFAQEQRRLRIHLRRQLLIHGDTRDTHPSPTPSPGTLRARASQEQLSKWKGDAISCDVKWQQRHSRACLIQHCVRKWLSKRQLQELPSSSEFIAIPAAAATTVSMPPQRFDHATTTALVAWPSDAPISIQTATIPTFTEPFQVIIELLGARDLASAQTMNLDGAAGVIADVRLVDSSLEKVVLGRLETPSMPLTLASSDGIQWDDQVLQIGIDPEKFTAEKVLAECVVVVDVSVVKPNSPQMTAVGRLSVSMDLLETPLADQYAMTRWFPLERSSGGGLLPARGELRVSIRFLMRKTHSKNKYGDGTTGDDDVWEPYCGAPVAPVDPPMTVAPKRTSAVQPRKQPSHAAKSTIPGKPTAAKPPLSPRRQEKCAPGLSSSSVVKSKRIASPVRNRKVEVISPPSSPSSYSSDGNAMDSELDIPSSPKRGPSPRKRGSCTGIVAAAQATNKPQRSSLRESLTPKMANTYTKIRRDSAETPGDRWSSVSHDDHESSNNGSGDSASPKKPFLKRKPYKVVFRKLDWSRVGSKTDSGSGAAKGAVAGSAGSAGPAAALTTAAIPQATGSARPGPAVLLRGGKSGHAADATNRSDPTATAVHTAAVMERLSAVIAQVHASCKVTPETAALAHMKYKSERNKLFAQCSAAGSSKSPVDQHAAECSASAAMETATTKSPRVDDLVLVQTLWRELHADADGSLYAQRLADALTQPQPPSCM